MFENLIIIDGVKEGEKVMFNTKCFISALDDAGLKRRSIITLTDFGRETIQVFSSNSVSEIYEKIKALKNVSQV